MKNIVNYLFQDNTGTYVVGQPPNMLIYVMVVAFIGQLFIEGSIEYAFELLFFGAGFAWGYLEIRYGESLFRRIAGVVLLVILFVSRLY